VTFISAALTGLLLFGQFLLVLGFMSMVICTMIIIVVARDIWNTIKVNKERRGVH
jgi:hypothetical protein